MAALLLAGSLTFFLGHGRCEAVEIVAAVADAVVLEGNPEAGPLENQFRAQFEPLLKVELSFANRVCKLKGDQRRNLIAKSKVWLDQFLADYAKQGNQPQMVGWFGGMRQTNDPRDSIRAGVAKLVKAELPAEQAAMYSEECKKRVEFHKKTYVDNLVTRIDHELILAPEQSEKITRSLTEHWDKNWQAQLEMFIQGVNMWPAVPDQWIRPHLTAVQQIAWGRLNKQHGNMVFGGIPIEGQVIDDIDLDVGQKEDDETAVVGEQPAAAVLAAPIPAN
jgi:hypothetical protein